MGLTEGKLCFLWSLSVHSGRTRRGDALEVHGAGGTAGACLVTQAVDMEVRSHSGLHFFIPILE